MFIKFESISYKNFLSAGNVPIVIQLNEAPTTVIFGKNGRGKSTFIDAIYFALFGKSYRKDVKNSLVNYITGKHTEVELIFSVGDKQYKIVRKIKPNEFLIYCNDELVDKSPKDYQKYLESYILHMDEMMFKQTVILGSTNYIPFMKLTTPDRRNVIEGLLDISIFGVMNKLAKVKQRQLKNLVQNLDYEINTLKIKKDSLEKVIQTKSESINERIDVWNLQIEELNEVIEATQDKIEELEDKKSKYVDKLDKLSDIDKAKTNLNDMRKFKFQFEHTISENKKMIRFYEKHDECPTCHHPLESEFKNIELDRLQSELDSLSGNVKLADEKISQTGIQILMH